MKTLFKLPSILALVGLMTLLVSAVSANNDGSRKYPIDEKNYSVSGCDTYGTGTKTYTEYAGYIKNRTKSHVSVVCPIIRDRPGHVYYDEYDTPFLTYYRIYVDFRGSNDSTKKTSCTLYFYDKEGKYLNSDTSTGRVGFNDQINRQTGTFSLLCSIPPGGYLYNYNVTETLN